VDLARVRRAAEVVLAALDDPAFSHTSHVRVVVDGQPVVDHHRRGPLSGDVFSITKTVLALLVGAAAGRGLVPALDAPVTDVLPELSDTPAAAHTWRHLLTMTRGCASDGAWDVDEITALPAGQVRHVACAPQLEPAGGGFRYDDGGAHLLAAALQRAVHRPLLEFADEALFAPLGIDDWSWLSDREGVPYGFAHLSLSARSLGHVGELLLHAGTVAGRRLVPASFVWEMTTAHSGGGVPEHLPYGYLCWIDPAGVLAGGWAGQHLLVLPRASAVVVVTGDPGFRFGPPPQDDLPEGWRPALELVRAHLLPALGVVRS
jgi:CubicO group peptidase (beta-lactamase class C family)